MRTLLAIAALLLLLANARDVVADPQLQKAAILTTAVEAVVATVSLAEDHNRAENYADDLTSLGWDISFSERDWRLSVSGAYGSREVAFTMSGFLWGNEKETWTVTYAGLGTIGDTPLQINGQSVWQYSSEHSDYRDMDFRHSVKFGEHSSWSWIVGGEVIIGGTIGAGAAVIGTSVGTGGLALGAAVWIGAGGFLAGSSALVSLSQVVKSIAEEPGPVPEIPARPNTSEIGPEISAQEGTIVTAVSGTELRAIGPEGRYVLKGENFSDKGYAKGSVSLIKK